MAKIPVATYNYHGVGIDIDKDTGFIQLSIYDIIPNDSWFEDREGRAINLTKKSAKAIGNSLLALAEHIETMDALKRSL